MTRALPPPGVGNTMASDLPRTRDRMLDSLPTAEGGWDCLTAPSLPVRGSLFPHVAEIVCNLFEAWCKKSKGTINGQ